MNFSEFSTIILSILLNLKIRKIRKIAIFFENSEVKNSAHKQSDVKESEAEGSS